MWIGRIDRPSVTLNLFLSKGLTMQRKIFGGCLICLVGLATVALLTPIQATQAPIEPPPSGCMNTPEAECLKVANYDGGCNPIPCCPQGQTSCGTPTRSTISVANYVSFGLGRCMKRSSHATEAFCTNHHCDGTGSCPSASCGATGDPWESFRKPYEDLGDCLPSQ